MKPKRPNITARDIELAVVQHFGARQNICVPNVSWGFLSHEADLLVIRQTGYCDEVEIKVTLSDLKADLRKYKWRRPDDKIRRMWFALPTWLAADALALLPAAVGILAVHPESFLNGRAMSMRVETVQGAAATRARALTTAEIAVVMRLGCMRIWTLKAECARWKRIADDAKAKGAP